MATQTNNITTLQENGKSIDTKQCYWEPWVRQHQALKPQVSKHDYCQQHQLHYAQFLYWYKKISITSESHHVIPVTVKPTSTAAPTTPQGAPVATVQMRNGAMMSLYTAEVLILALEQLL